MGPSSSTSSSSSSSLSSFLRFSSVPLLDLPPALALVLVSSLLLLCLSLSLSAPRPVVVVVGDVVFRFFDNFASRPFCVCSRRLAISSEGLVSVDALRLRYEGRNGDSI